MELGWNAILKTSTINFFEKWRKQAIMLFDSVADPFVLGPSRFLKSAQNSASFDTLHAQFRRNFFSPLIRDSTVFLEVKSSNKIETDQYFKKRFFIN
jgi:hypothetical protein